MAGSAVFDLINALVDRLTLAMPSVVVYDGYPDSEDLPQQFVVVGVPNPYDETAATSATTQQSWAHANNTARNEQGDVFCVASVTDGSNNARAARTGLQAIVGAVENLLRTDYSLGVPTLLWTSYGVSTDLIQDQTKQGASAQLTFSIFFRARI